MTNSALTTLAAERRQANSARLTALCRTLTAERGLNGFTIEEVCSEVGVSRRTFFNYFPTKEDAVFGVDEVDEMRRFSEEFITRGSRGWSVVVDDLVDLIGRFAEDAGLNAADHVEFMRVLEREPRLLLRFIGTNRERDAALVGLVAQREGVPADDARASASVAVVSAVLRTVFARLSDPAVGEHFAAALVDALDAMREVLAPGKAHS